MASLQFQSSEVGAAGWIEPEQVVAMLLSVQPGTEWASVAPTAPPLFEAVVIEGGIAGVDADEGSAGGKGGAVTVTAGNLPIEPVRNTNLQYN